VEGFEKYFEKRLLSPVKLIDAATGKIQGENPHGVMPEILS